MPKVAPKIHITLTFTQEELDMIERWRLVWAKDSFRNEALIGAVKQCLANSDGSERKPDDY